MNRNARLTALSEFLKARRARLQPELAGLPAGTRRRTPGLRREEVAQLAGVSTTWYTWLEQGRDIQMSPHVLDCVAAALQLNDDERSYLMMLALEHQVQPSGHEAPPVLGAPARRILDELTNCPAIVSDRRCHIVGWNRAAASVFLDFEQVPPEERNMIRLLFTRKELRSLAVNWSDFVQGFLAIFRTYYGQYVGDPWYGEFIGKLSGENAEFASFWSRNEVSSAPEVCVEFRHAQAGKMLFDLSSLQWQGSADLRFSIYTPYPHSGTEAKMTRLMRKREIRAES